MCLEKSSNDSYGFLSKAFYPIRAADIAECVRKYVDGISQNLCFRSYGLWLNKSNHRVKLVDISESININQSISMN